ncbi:unnamed protein product [Strongylus vulgaris]|uniref:Uncharacterized protein n=1 Tax=Strongylus vulgaris TaxID=40348 RepID=A0A3P7J719_STRVU|nr:unnamed protein product [Strongylus vulgaris]
MSRRQSVVRKKYANVLSMAVVQGMKSMVVGNMKSLLTRECFLLEVAIQNKMYTIVTSWVWKTRIYLPYLRNGSLKEDMGTFHEATYSIEYLATDQGAK